MIHFFAFFQRFFHDMSVWSHCHSTLTQNPTAIKETPSKKARRKERRSSGEKKHKCHICEKGYTSEGNLSMHMKIHLNKREFQCHICGKEFVQKNGLVVHIRHRHTNEKPYMCPHCNKGLVLIIVAFHSWPIDSWILKKKTFF